MNENRSQLRLWTISAAVALLMHGGVVIAVLKWHWAAPTQPLMIDLAPAPAAPNPEPSLQPSSEPSSESSSEPNLQPSPEPSTAPNLQQSNAALAPGSEPLAVPAASEQIQDNDAAHEPSAPAGRAVEANAAARGGGDTEPTAAPQGLLAPMPLSSGNAKPEIGARANTASGGGVALRAAPGGGGAGNPAVGAPAGASVTAGPVASHPVALGPDIGNPVIGKPVINNPATNNSVTGGPNGPAAGARVINGPVANAPARSDPFANSPIDTSITVQPGPNGRRGLAAIEGKTAAPAIGQRGGVFFHPARVGQPERIPGVVLPGVTATRTTGAHVQDRARAATARRINAIGSAETVIVGRGATNAAGRATTSAIGTAEGGVAGNGGANAEGAVAVNSVGIAVHPSERHSVAPVGERGANSVATAARSLPAAPVINGGGMIRPGSGPAGIGGPPARTATGVLNGTNFHTKVP